MNRGQLARKKVLRSKVVNHHLRYAYNGLTHKQEERVVPIYFNEHYLTRLLQTRGKYVSKGFLFVLVDFVLDRLITSDFIDLSPRPPDAIKETEPTKDKTGEPCQTS